MFSDWISFFWPQIEQPCTVQPMLFNLPWLFVALQPMRLIGMYPALALVDALSLVVIIKLARRLGLSPLRTVMVLFSAPVVWIFFMGQIDGLVLAAYLAPPALATFLALAKPQAAIFAGWSALRRRPLLVAALSGALLASAFLIWRWPLSTSGAPQVAGKFSLLPPLLSGGWNWSLWPWGVLLIPAALRRPHLVGLFASPFLFPYAGLQSLIGPILVIAARAPGWLFGLAWLALWARLAWMLAGA